MKSPSPIASGDYSASRLAAKDIAESANRDDLGIIEHRPDKDGQDWNDVLKAATAEPTPTATRYDPPVSPRLKP